MSQLLPGLKAVFTLLWYVPEIKIILGALRGCGL